MKIKESLYRQLILIAIIICGIVFISLGLLLPRLMLPIYEKNIYQYLSQPLEFIQVDSNYNELDDIAYLYVTQDKQIMVSNNLNTIIDLMPNQILDKIKPGCGKFTYISRNYYYCSTESQYITKVTMTNDSYISNIRKDILTILLPTLFITLLFSCGIIVLWAQNLVIKINKLKKKVYNLDNYDYVDDYNYNTIDELSELSTAIDNIKATLLEQEEYKNQMYQNISHDFKTPLTVMKSYIEAIDDDMLDEKEGRKIIKEQVLNLEHKVHSLLYLNKLNYIQNLKAYSNEQVDVREIVNNSITKFQISRPDVKFTVVSSNKVFFNGTFDMWEAIIDNLLNNFVRYAKKEIKITIKNNKIILYNDGPKIDEKIIEDVFTPYTKGMKGQFGLGLSIVKKTLSLLGYEISIQNERTGVSFIIK